MQKIYCLLIIPILILAGCGGGSDSGGGSAIITTPTIAKVTLSTRGIMPEDKSLAGIGVTLQLPAGVTPELDSAGGVDGGVTTPSGVLAKRGTVLTPIYIAPSGSTPGKLTFVIVSTAAKGFGIGEFATVSLKIAPGSAIPTVTDYSIPSANTIDLSGLTLKGVTVSFTAETI